MSSPASRNRANPPGLEVSWTWARAGHRYREINTSSRYGGTYQKSCPSEADRSNCGLP